MKFWNVPSDAAVQGCHILSLRPPTPPLLPRRRAPYTDDIAMLNRELGTQVGIGAPGSPPDTGQRKGPSSASSDQTVNTTGSPDEAVSVF